MGKNLYWFLFLLGAALCCLPVCVQAQDKLYTLSKHFTSENGLPQNSVKAIGVDDYGFIWLATEAGLVRFDGRKFKQYDKLLSGEPFNRIYLIVNLDGKNNIAALNEVDSVFYMRRGRAFKSEAVLNQNKPNKLISLWFDFFPYIWFYDRRTYKESRARFLDGVNKSIEIDNNGLITWYIQDTLRATYLYGQHTSCLDYFFLKGSLYHINFKKGGHITMVTPSGHTTAKISGNAMNLNEEGEAILCYNSGTNQQFLTIGNKLYYIDEVSKGHIKTELLIDGFDFKRELIRSIYYDKKNQKILIGSMTNGLFVFDKKSFNSYTIESDDPRDNVIYSQINMGKGRVLASNGTVFDLIKGNSFKLLKTKNVEHRTFDWTIFQASNKDIWAANMGKLFHYDSLGRLIKTHNNIPRINTMSGADSGRFWLSQQDKKFKIIRVTPSAGSDSLINTLFFTSTEYVGSILQTGNHLWLGTIGGLYKANLLTRKVEKLPDFNKMAIRFLKYDDKEGILWIGTYEDGFYCYQNGRAFKMPLDPDKYLKSVHSIQKDRHGCFWISTNNGLFQIPENDLQAYVKNNTGNVFYLYYNTENGFLSNEFNGGGNITSLKLADSLLSFSSMKGLVSFNPESIKDVLPVNPLILDEIQVNDSVIYAETDVLTVKRGFKRIRFKLATAYLGNPNNLLYEYKLDDAEWAPMNDDRIEFNDLSSQKHTLYFRKASGFNNVYLYKTIQINILPFWWQTTLFKVSAVILVSLLIWLAVYFRIKNLRKRNEELQRQVALRTLGLKEANNTLEKSRNELQEQLVFQRTFNEGLSHEVKTPLKYLTTFIRQLNDAKKNGVNPNEEELGLIYTTSNEIYEYTSNLTAKVKEKFELGNNHPVNVRKLIEKTCMLFQVAAGTKNIIFQNNIEASIGSRNNKAILEKIIHNLIDNSVKYTDKGKIIFNAAKENDMLTIEIRDTGIGMNADVINEYNKYFGAIENEEENLTGINYGLGFRNIKKALIWINATLELSAIPDGTVCILKIKDGNLI